jgi:BolA protein
MDNASRIERMKTLLTEKLSPSHLEIIDDSYLHAGHAGAQSGKGHFTVIIQSDSFAGKRPIQCHQLVYGALGEMMQSDIHALSIKIV